MSLFRFVFAVFIFSMVPYVALAQDDSTIKPLPGFLDNIGKTQEAPAEEITPPKTDISAPKTETQKSDLSDIPDEYIIEASQFGEKCRNDYTMPLYFDCRCLGVKYLDARIEMGPDASPSGVQNRLGKACKDGTGIAGQLYEECLNDFVNAPTHLDPEEYCSCYGNTFAEYFEDLPGRMNPRTKIALLSKAKLTCQDPAAARRIYGNGVLTR